MRQLFLEALAGKNQNRPPVWLMRQAGRYMPSYQKLRAHYGLMEMFTNKELIHEVTLQPIETLDVDAAIVFSDILLILDVMGMQVGYGQGVTIGSPLVGFEDPRLDLSSEVLFEKMDFLQEAICSLKKDLKVPLIGFVAAPWTIACYAWNSKEAATATGLHGALWRDPIKGTQMLKKFQKALLELAMMQVKAGVDAIQIFDSHSHLLSPKEYHQWIVEPIKEMIQTIGAHVPVIYFTRASTLFAQDLVTLPNCCLSVDWQSDLNYFRSLTKQPLQGAFNPWQLLGAPKQWKGDLQEMLKSRRGDSAYICGLGHGVLPSTPVEHVKEFVQEVQSLENDFSSKQSVQERSNSCCLASSKQNVSLSYE